MTVEILVGDCRERLREMPAESVQCVVTSPPYFNLREYGHDGQIGHETTPEDFILSLVEVFQEVRRVLKPEGTLWLNLGDAYAKSKQRLLIPARAALALQSDGWLLRDEVVWHKPAVLPVPVKDRTVPCHEFLYTFAKQRKYQYDYAAIREPAAPESAARYKYGFGGAKNEDLKASGRGGPSMIGKRDFDGMRNRRSVWTVVPDRSRVAHCAPFPPSLIEPCILAGSHPGDRVLDPFGGSGTTGLVADKHGRDCTLIELNPEYADIARERCGLAPAPALEDLLA